MAIADVVTMGYGSFGSVNKLPTLGYSIGASLVPDIPGIEFRVRDDRLHWAIRDERLHFRVDDDKLHFNVEEQ